MDVDNFVEMVDFSYKLVQKFSTKSMFDWLKLVEKLQNGITNRRKRELHYVTK